MVRNSESDDRFGMRVMGSLPENAFKGESGFLYTYSEWVGFIIFRLEYIVDSRFV